MVQPPVEVCKASVSAETLPVCQLRGAGGKVVNIRKIYPDMQLRPRPPRVCTLPVGIPPPTDWRPTGHRMVNRAAPSAAPGDKVGSSVDECLRFWSGASVFGLLPAQAGEFGTCF